MVMGTNRSQGMIVDIILGILGGAVGNWLLPMLGMNAGTGFNLYSLFVAVVGASVLIFIGRLLFK
jgi:uncharacterized membrane protein YeaQ/YmgE (transglycosylase-associated protein family)